MANGCLVSGAYQHQGSSFLLRTAKVLFHKKTSQESHLYSCSALGSTTSVKSVGYLPITPMNPDFSHHYVYDSLTYRITEL